VLEPSYIYKSCLYDIELIEKHEKAGSNTNLDWRTFAPLFFSLRISVLPNNFIRIRKPSPIGISFYITDLRR
jgi:hypothetical protein